MNITFTLDCKVLDTRQLWDAAYKHLREVDGLSHVHAVYLISPDGGEIDVAACVKALLDPVNLPGLDIKQSHVEATCHR